MTRTLLAVISSPVPRAGVDYIYMPGAFGGPLLQLSMWGMAGKR